MTASGVAEYEPLWKPMPLTPIQRSIGFRVAEDVLEDLPLGDYIVLECLGLGWQQQEIAELLGVDPSSVSIRLKQLRVLLADSQLHKMLLVRQYVKAVVKGEYHES
jgi:DNA-binding NarL/FixJ family response regulator